MLPRYRIWFCSCLVLWCCWLHHRWGAKSRAPDHFTPFDWSRRSSFGSFVKSDHRLPVRPSPAGPFTRASHDPNGFRKVPNTLTICSVGCSLLACSCCTTTGSLPRVCWIVVVEEEEGRKTWKEYLDYQESTAAKYRSWEPAVRCESHLQ
jgi:hypothetical protein